MTDALTLMTDKLLDIERRLVTVERVIAECPPASIAATAAREKREMLMAEAWPLLLRYTLAQGGRWPTPVAAVPPGA